MAELKFEAARTCSSGPIPDGLKLSWKGSPDGQHLQLTDQQTVIESSDGGKVYAFCYRDNRSSMAFVKYSGDKPGKIVEKKGARYPWAIGMAPEGKYITVCGQDNKQLTVPFSELGIS